MQVQNSVARPSFFQTAPVAPVATESVDIELGHAPVASQVRGPQGLQLVAPGEGPLVGAGKMGRTKGASIGTAVVLGVLGTLAIATGLAVGLGPDNNSGRWIGGWVGAFCGVGAALLAGSTVACCVAKRQTTAC